MTKPIVAITMGDPAGVGPEISILGLSKPELFAKIRPIIIGDAKRLQLAYDILKEKGRFTPGNELWIQAINNLEGAGTQVGRVDVLDLQNVPADLPWGEMRAEAGKACFEYLKKAVELAQNGAINAVCTAPINKEAWKASGIHYPGHTDALGDLLNSPSFATMLVNDKLRVVHVSTHISLIQAIHYATKEHILARIELAHNSLKALNIKDPRIAVAGLNPHAGENGLFGSEDSQRVLPAVQAALAKGINVSGPYPPDSVFARASNGEFDVVIALYHDQGHIAIKMLGNGFDTGVNVTIGLPILRTSVDHGTAFDIAGKGVARERSMLEALAVTVDFLAGSC